MGRHPSAERPRVQRRPQCGHGSRQTRVAGRAGIEPAMSSLTGSRLTSWLPASGWWCGGRSWTRTSGLRLVVPALSPLSYPPAGSAATVPLQALAAEAFVAIEACEGGLLLLAAEACFVRSHAYWYLPAPPFVNVVPRGGVGPPASCVWDRRSAVELPGRIAVGECRLCAGAARWPALHWPHGGRHSALLQHGPCWTSHSLTERERVAPGAGVGPAASAVSARRSYLLSYPGMSWSSLPGGGH